MSPIESAPEETRAPEPSLVDSTAAGATALRGSVMLGISYAVSILLSLISVPLLIRHLGISGFGRYSTVIAIVTVVNGLTDAGLFNIALREWATLRDERRREMMRVLLGIRIELSALGVLAGVAFAAIAGYGHVMVLGTLLAGIGMATVAVTNILTVSLQGELRFGWASTIDIARQAVSVALIVALVLAGAGLLPFLAVGIPAGIAMILWASVLVHRDMPLRPRLRDSSWLPLVRDTLPYAAAIALNTLYFRVTIVVCSLVAPAAQTGYFATSFRVTEVLVGVPALAIGAAFPILSRSASTDRERFARAAERIIELSLLAGIGLALVVVLSAPFVIDVTAGAAGHPAVGVLQIQGLALIATFLASASGYGLISLRRHRSLLVSNLTALVANVVLTLVLVPSGGARGAATAAVIAESSLAAAQLLLLWRTGIVRVRPGMVPVPVIAGLAGAAVLLVPHFDAVPRTFAGIAVYLAVITLGGRLPPEIMHALRRERAG